CSSLLSLSSCPKLTTSRGHHWKSKNFRTDYPDTSTYLGEPEDPEFSDFTGIARGPESLRGKHNQLLKGIYRRRSISARYRRKNAQAVGCQRLAHMPGIPNLPPSLNLRAPDLQACQLLRQFNPRESLTRGQRRSCEYKPTKRR
ncbi:uncharacterized protein N7515_003699, partial [Penicillium bovifimosum]